MYIIRVVYFLQRQKINTLILIQIKVKNDKMKNGVEIIPANNNCWTRKMSLQYKPAHFERNSPSCGPEAKDGFMLNLSLLLSKSRWSRITK